LGLAGRLGGTGGGRKNRDSRYCLEVVQRPLQPPDCLKIPEPLWPGVKVAF
jgi:hypothetical protein